MRAQEVEKIAVEILDFLVEHRMWVDVRIYFNGKVWSSYNKDTQTFHYNDKSKLYEEEADPKEYFEFVADPHILSMSFEGAFYDVINGASVKAHKLQKQFENILSKHGLYYKLGNGWNLTLYEE